MSFNLLEGLPPGGTGSLADEFNGRKAAADQFARRLPIVRTFGPRNEIAEEHWAGTLTKFFSTLSFVPEDESKNSRRYEEPFPSAPRGEWVYFHGGRPDYDYGECVFVLKSDLPKNRHCDLSVTPFGLPNLVGSEYGFKPEDIDKACLVIRREDWLAFFADNDWNGTWREKLAVYYNYQMEGDTTVYLWADPQHLKHSRQPQRRAALNGLTLWPDTVEDYRAWTVELRLRGGLRLDVDTDGSYTIYVRDDYLNFLDSGPPAGTEENLARRWHDANDRVLSLRRQGRLVTVGQKDGKGDHVALTRAAMAITEHLTS